MARGQRKSIEEKIAEKENLIEALQTRIGSEQGELEELYRQKRDKDLQVLTDLLDDAGLSPDDASEILKEHLQL